MSQAERDIRRKQAAVFGSSVARFGFWPALIPLELLEDAAPASLDTQSR